MIQRNPVMDMDVLESSKNESDVIIVLDGLGNKEFVKSVLEKKHCMWSDHPCRENGAVFGDSMLDRSPNDRA